MTAARVVVMVALVAVTGAAQTARRGPEFLDRAIIYQIWMRSFTPEGTLAAAQKRLPHIADLGASIVYLSPINLMSRQGGYSNPYRIKDYYAIDPEYGTEEDLKAFVAEAHRLKLKVLMDIVFYHTAPDSVMMATPEFYLHKDGQIVLGNWKLPRPDFGNPKLREYLWKNLLHWARDCGVDGFRCDVSFGVPTDFWEEARRRLDAVNKDFILLAESEKPEEMARAFDISYGFSNLRAVQRVFRDGEPATALRAQWEKIRAQFPRGTRFLRMSDNHDQQRAVVEFGARGAAAAAVYNFTMDGIPFLYAGQEIGDTTATNHQSHYPMRWDLDKPEVPSTPSLVRSQKRVWEWYKQLFRLRLSNAELTGDDVAWVENSQPESVVSYVRGGGVLVVVNVSNRKCSGTVKLQGKPQQGLLAGQGDTMSGDAYQLGPFGYWVGKVQ